MRNRTRWVLRRAIPDEEGAATRPNPPSVPTALGTCPHIRALRSLRSQQDCPTVSEVTAALPGGCLRRRWLQACRPVSPGNGRGSQPLRH